MLIQDHLLPGRFPERTDLLDLAPGRKSMLLHPQRDETFEVADSGIIATCLPLPYGAPGDMQQIS
jgi:hypothetical protein